MTIENWISVGALIVDLLKSLIPFGAVIVIVYFFKDDIKKLVRDRGLKLSGPGGISLETLEDQQKNPDADKEKEIKALNEEVKTTRLQNKKLLELQKYTTRDNDTFFIGYHFEKTYRLLFPSQMVILNIMKNNNNEVSKSLAMSIFRRTTWSQQLKIPFVHFMGFLESSGLVSYNQPGDKYVVAPLGATFLKYLENNNIPFKIPANDIIIPAT